MSTQKSLRFTYYRPQQKKLL